MYGTYCRLNLNVSVSARAVIRASAQLIKVEARFARTTRAARHNFYRQMLDYHRGAQEMVRYWRL
ncbi:MAG: hypothetical protein KGQ46_13790 [Hyphomicrobiales bacterium]|nr:hypothetical protein [Hyphomicrobiales bacterium]MDE2115064.1 hypothetical protein [Hyphomicrobiales bacterium]